MSLPALPLRPPVLLLALAPLLALGACAPRHAAGPIIDVHAHLRSGDDDGLSADHPRGTTALRGLEERAGVGQAGLIVIAPRGQPAVTRARNDAVIAAARMSGGFFFAVASVHPLDGAAALSELERVAGLGVRVIKLHPNTQAFDVGDPAVAAVTRRAGELGLVLLFDGFSPFDANQPGKFLRLAIQHPQARLILAHLGGVRFHDMALFGIARKFPWYPRNVWFDLSATASFYAGSPYQGSLLWVIRSVGTDRVLFGSDWPVDEPARALRALRQLGLTEAELQEILSGNARALLRPSGAP